MPKLNYTRIAEAVILPSPNNIEKEIPLTRDGIRTVSESREMVAKSIRLKNSKFVFIAGPCCAERIEPVLDFTARYKALPDSYSVVRLERVAVVKPRSNLPSYQGPFFDFQMNGQSHPLEALYYCRRMMVAIANAGMPIATEVLDEVGLPHLSSTMSFVWAGARDSIGKSVISMMSGSSAPGGLKHPLNGDIAAAGEALKKTRVPQWFSGIDHDTGMNARLFTTGNDQITLILRGTSNGPNYDEDSIASVCQKLDALGLSDIGIIVDISHGNSHKDHKKQFAVLREVIRQRRFAVHGHRIVGVMIEAYLIEGSQKLPSDLSGFDANTLTYGQSVVDGCVGFEELSDMWQFVTTELR